MKRMVALFCALQLLLQCTGFTPASAAYWSQDSKFDTVFDGKIPNRNYDLEFISVRTTDNRPDNIYFTLEFAQVPTVEMFNDGLGSFGSIVLDYDFDGSEDARLQIDKVTMTGDGSIVSGGVYQVDGKYASCPVGVYTNINGGDKWVGLRVSRSCIELPTTFEMYGYAEYADKTMGDSYDYAPWPPMRVTVPGTSTAVNPSTDNSFSGLTYALPTTSLNSSYMSSNFTEPPKDLSKLSEQLLSSVVTVRCLTGSGTGWSADLNLSTALVSAGYQSLVITNHHVIEDCMSSKSVTIVLSNGASVPGEIVSWNSSSDLAGVATVTSIPSLQWIGSPPRQGWWVGVLGSPLGKSNVLTTGIISSVNNLAKTFTLTAPINPGNSGGPVFDLTGRVLGLATSKRLLSSGQLAEGFGNAHGVPLLCTSIVICDLEKDPWGGISKFELKSTDAASVSKADTIKEKTDACIQHNNDLKLVLYSLKTAKTLYPASELLLQGTIDDAPESIECSFIDVETFDAELQGENTLLKAFKSIAKSAITRAQTLSKKKSTISCVNGKLTKKVTAVNPKCPTGFKKK